MDVWGFIWLMVFLKIPVGLLLYICWWAVHSPVEDVEAAIGDDGDGDGGGSDRAGHRTPLGRGPRPRGPHGDGMPGSPPRTRAPLPERRSPVR